MVAPRTRALIAREPTTNILTAAGLIAAGWAIDAWRRDRAAHLLHRTLVDLLLNALHSGDAETERHSRRVADLTDALAATYHLGRRARARLRLAALLHDVGKMDDRLFEIVHSCESLSPEDRREMERHPNRSAAIIRPLEEVHPGISRIVGSHHECWNGEGYPNGLIAGEIPLEARILSAADVFDAMTQPRSYHEPHGVDEALERIRRSAGERFDPEVVRRLERREVKERWALIAAMGRLQESRAGEEREMEENAEAEGVASPELVPTG